MNHPEAEQYEAAAADLQRAAGTAEEKGHPGPWSVRMRDVPIADTGDYDPVIELVDANGKTIAEIWDPTDEQVRAFGLCAAAPALLEKVREFAASCAECDGSGRIATAPQGDDFGGYMEKCEACADINDVLRKVAP